MDNIAIITARSGSKGLPDKNIRELNGKPLLAYSIEAAFRSGCFKEIMVSTDSNVYAEIAKSFGASVPFLRSKKMSSDIAGSWETVREVLSMYSQTGRYFDTVCLLQPTSPLRTSEDIVNGYDLFIKKNADAVTSVCELDYSPSLMMPLSDSLSLKEFRKNLKTVRRQDEGKYYRINGALYIRGISYENGVSREICDNEFAYIMDRKRSVDVDTIEDFKYAEYLMNTMN